MSNRVFNVLFICDHNSARSIMAEVLLRREGMRRFQGWSAGHEPRSQIEEMADILLQREGMSTEGLHPKSWDQFLQPGAPKLDFVIALSDRVVPYLPIFPGHPTRATWGISDPTDVESLTSRALAFGDTFRQLRRRLGAFCSLPDITLNTLAGQNRLVTLGEAEQPKPAMA
ncbi:MAG: arsenate reductase ArsC [Rhodobacteraceae bacterium]|nr:arsenate reductase ArsC [Paracoccaceae bacterium]